MQLSAANLLIAAQQHPRPAAPAGQTQFAAALKGEGQTDSGFAPLAFRQTASASAARPAPSQAMPSQLGAALDIRV